ncbi:MAG TPA: EAL domain-containing protein [Microvirga sp.]|jgi:diguanylate cyclase (GGDEF)-like protein|nr:EAL domain-containing protein [Microvirga sp.]
MSRVSLLQRSSHSALLFRLVWPTAILFSVTLAVVFAMIMWTSDAANREAAEKQRVQFEAALDQRLAEWTQALNALEVGLPGLRREGTPFDALAVFGRDGTLIEADGLGPTLRQDAEALVRVSPEAPVSRLVSDGQGADVLSIRPFVWRGGTGHLVGVKGYAAADFRRLAGLNGIQGAYLAAARPEQDSVIPLQDVAGTTRAYLAWPPERPGDLLRQRLIPVLGFGLVVALLLLGVLVLYIRWLAKDLAQSQEQARTLVGRDPLSSLPNRLLFTERLDYEIGRLGRVEGGIAVHLLDLDRFKDVNDTYGHSAGDELIKQVADRLSKLLRGGDTLARLGGDEFAVIQTGLRNMGDAEALARRMLDAISLPFAIAGAQVSVGVSIGIAVAPENGLTHELLMRLADTALYQAKSEGRNRFSFFERTMDEAIRMRKVVEDDLRHAIARNELALHYQPVFSADGSTIVGVEALVRWPHAKQGMISPTRFIGLAEERGLVIPLGEWVLRRACEDGKRWPGLRIAVNVSPLQFRHRDYVESVVTTIKETGFDPTRLELELTEGVVVEDADAAEAAMMELRALGVNLALDDFGTGYSSLIYLRRFAFDKIKIDRSFLESMEATGESAILVHSIVHLGRALGLTVTAEGVETKEQHRFLQALGCHQLQGFLFSRPVPPEEIDRLLGLSEAAQVA